MVDKIASSIFKLTTGDNIKFAHHTTLYVHYKFQASINQRQQIHLFTSPKATKPCEVKALLKTGKSDAYSSFAPCTENSPAKQAFFKKKKFRTKLYSCLTDEILNRK